MTGHEEVRRQEGQQEGREAVLTRVDAPRFKRVAPSPVVRIGQAPNGLHFAKCEVGHGNTRAHCAVVSVRPVTDDAIRHLKAETQAYWLEHYGTPAHDGARAV